MIKRWWQSLSRDSRSHLLVAALCFAWAVSSQMQVGAADRRVVEQQASERAVAYGLWYALTQEQAKAGQFEAERNAAWAELRGVRYQLGAADARLEACNATTAMTTDEGWTGQLQLKTEKTR
ncbi:hypothetical protein [Salinicola endophyticus]|uniref:Uncharacterized protein n=1 Tax=Salinicola endophyticus TaxID=1949083 RepID=A0AB74UAA0_9GAMM